MTRLVRKSNGNSVTLGSALDSGGEGRVHAVAGAPGLLAKLFRTPLPDQGYVVGDVNETNVLVNAAAAVFLLDLDSVQVHVAATGKTYLCRVGKAEFTPPELLRRPGNGSFAAQARTEIHDRFGLGA